MMRWTSFLVLVSLAVIAPTTARASAQTTYEEALVKENGERDLEGALGLYQQVALAVDASAALQQQASYRMAVCLERLGRQDEALSAYKRLLEQKPARELELDAQTSIRRVQNQLNADRDTRERSVEPATTTSGALSIQPVIGKYNRWSFSVEGGYSILDGPGEYTNLSQEIFWTSLGYKTAPWCELGIEGGRFFPKVRHISTDHSTFPETGEARLTTTYVGPYIQVSRTMKALPLDWMARVGVGAGRQNVRVQTVTQNFLTGIPFTDDISETRTDGAIVLSGGVDWNLNRWLSLGVGGRFFLLIQTFTSINDDSQNFKQEESYRPRYVGAPYVRLTLHF